MYAVIDNLDGRGLLLITHRPTALERMDEIIEMDLGVVRRRLTGAELQDAFAADQSEKR